MPEKDNESVWKRTDFQGKSRVKAPSHGEGPDPAIPGNYHLPVVAAVLFLGGLGHRDHTQLL